MARTKALTDRDWLRLFRATDTAEHSDAFRAAVEEIVRERMARAWRQGFKRGWHEGVKDATEDDGGNVDYPNPYEKATS